jgi:hypothetical protein
VPRAWPALARGHAARAGWACAYARASVCPSAFRPCDARKGCAASAHTRPAGATSPRECGAACPEAVAAVEAAAACGRSNRPRGPAGGPMRARSWACRAGPVPGLPCGPGTGLVVRARGRTNRRPAQAEAWFVGLGLTRPAGPGQAGPHGPERVTLASFSWSIRRRADAASRHPRRAWARRKSAALPSLRRARFGIS